MHPVGKKKKNFATTTTTTTTWTDRSGAPSSSPTLAVCVYVTRQSFILRACNSISIMRKSLSELELGDAYDIFMDHNQMKMDGNSKKIKKKERKRKKAERVIHFRVSQGSRNEASGVRGGTKVQRCHIVQRILTLSEGPRETNKVLMTHLTAGFHFYIFFLITSHTAAQDGTDRHNLDSRGCNCVFVPTASCRCVNPGQL